MIEMVKCHRSPVEAGRKRDAKVVDAKMEDAKNSVNDQMMTSDKRRKDNQIRRKEEKISDCDSRKLYHSKTPQSLVHHLASPYHSSNLSVFLLVTTIIVIICLSDQVTLGRSSSLSSSPPFGSASHPSNAILDSSDSRWTPHGVSVIGHRKDVRMRGSHHHISPKKDPSPKGWIPHFIPPWLSSPSSLMTTTPNSVPSNSLSASPYHSSSSPKSPRASFSSSLSHGGHSFKGIVSQSHHATLDATKKMKEKEEKKEEKEGENETLPRATSPTLISPEDGIPKEQIPGFFWRHQSKPGDPINPMMMVSRARRALHSSSSHESRLYDVPQIGK